ncbi:MAG: cache domain-containing protein [Rhodobacteraceae bacterium]|nr:cache domain-containing protein [Paracoccaceae bacterium]
MASVICAAVFVAASVTYRATEAQRLLQQDIVLRGADAIALSFNTALAREWESLHAVARNIGNASYSEINDFMDAVVQTGGQVGWAGVADLGGTIVSGSNRLREGENVSARRWYRQGLRGPSVGNVYERTSLPGDANVDPQPVLNLSTPILDEDTGEVSGVVVYSLRIGWVQSFLAKAREQLYIDVIVQTRGGETLVDTRDVVLPLPDAAVVQAELGQSGAASFRLLDEADGLYAFTPNFINDTLPDFGWRVFAVLDRDRVTNVLPALLRHSVIAVTIAALFVVVSLIAILRIVMRPLEMLSANAFETANGAYVYPVESRSSREALMLSRGLVRIQEKLASLAPTHPDRQNGHLSDSASDGVAPTTLDVTYQPAEPGREHGLRPRRSGKS